MELTRVALNRPIFMLMLMVGSVMLGIFAWNGMRKELDPEVQFGVISVATIYPGAGPDEINNLVTRKIEDAVAAVPGIEDILSSSQEGVSTVAIQFEIGVDMNNSLNEVRAKVDAISGELPLDIERPIIDKLDTTSDPVFTMVVKGESKSPKELRDLVDNVFKDEISQVKGVARVAVSGGEEREIQIRLKKDELMRYGVGITEVQQAIQAASVNIPGGRIKEGASEFSVRFLSEFRTLEEMRGLYLQVSDGQGPRGEQRIVRLGDVADVLDAAVEKRTNSRLNGADAVVMSIQKSREGNAIEIAEALQKPGFGGISLLERLEEEHGVEFVTTLDTAKRIEESLFDLQFAIAFGIVLVTLTIYLFLHNLRGTLIVAIAIPICLALAVGAMWVMGFTLNNQSLLALSLAIGVLVDDAIVVLENIYRHLTMGEPPMEAAINGRSEIGLAAIAVTMVDVAVFLPVGFTGGVVGQFFKPLGLGFAACVFFSLLVSFTITPMLASRWYRQGEDWEHPKGGFAGWFEGSFNRFADGYARFLRGSLQSKWKVFAAGFTALTAVFAFIGGSTIAAEGEEFGKQAGSALFGQMPVVLSGLSIGLGLIGLLAVLISKRKFQASILAWTLAFAAVFPLASFGGYAYRNLYKKEEVFKFTFFPPSDQSRINIQLEMPTSSSLNETTRIVKIVEERIAGYPEIDSVVSTIGSQNSGFSESTTGTQFAVVTVNLHEKQAILDVLTPWIPKEEKLRTREDTLVAGDLRKMVDRIPGVKIDVSAAGGYAAGADIQIGLRGTDRELLLKAAGGIQERFAAGEIKGVISPSLSTKPGKPELVARPDRAKMADFGLTASQVGSTLRTMYEGNNQAKYRVGGREYDIRVMLAEEDRNDAARFSTVPITFKSGQPIFLDSVATVERAIGVDKIDRKSRQQEVVVTASLLPGYAAGTVQNQIDQWLEDERLIPEGVVYAPGGEAEIQARNMGYLMTSLVVGIVLVYMVLASLYDNLVYPFIIQLAQPQAFVGALLALMITDKPLNIIGFVGLIALVGLVGKNAILLVDYANTLRERGLSREEALVESGRTRLRPIMMTTIALLAGMLPIALAIGRGSEFRETIGIIIIGGITLSTMLTLFVIPASYVIFDGFSNFLQRIAAIFDPAKAGSKKA
jgi:HAE1 family hydrophobic/amphiphilic exporter-1